MTTATTLSIALAAPLAGAILNGLAGRRWPRAAVGTIACAAAGIAFLACLRAVYHPGAARLFDWIVAGDLNIPVGVRVDELSSVMVLVITGVGFLIHVYSLGYMKGDPGFARFFAYLNLFLFSMLLLVLADNLALMFVGWEGVGLCSYLLIGFWFDDPERAKAGQKAFLVNRVGDLGFLLGIFLAWTTFGTLSMDGVEAAAAGASVTWVIGLLLFVGACGKSAQIPLYVWLPDAMAGPTPVSALIHAATMVTAGVYMICRLDLLYAAAGWVPQLIGGVAAATSLLAALLAFGQTNLKRVLAYSTISQLGYMFCGAAAGATTAAMFHLTTHAFFKGLLFLGAGAVIHALHNEEDMRKMGGLWRGLPGVALTFAVGSLAMMGLPPLAGFWSKEEILTGVYAAHGPVWPIVWASLLMTAALTAAYTARMFWMTFLARGHAHELHRPGASMMLVLFILGGLSATGGIFGDDLTHLLGHPHAAGKGVTMIFSAIAILGGVGGYALFVKGAMKPAPWLARALSRKLWVDEAYQALVVLPIRALAAGLWLVVDRFLIDKALVDGSAAGLERVGGALSRGQSGVVNTLIGALLVGALLVGIYGLLIAWVVP